MRLLLLTGLVLVACNTSQSRAVQGPLTGAAAQAIVFSEKTTGDQTVTEAAPNGTFRLELPTGRNVTLLVAVRSGTSFDVVRHSGPTWFRLHPGETIDLGAVRPEGAPIEQLDPVTTPPV